ncbi:hypothetical protein [Rathayibacter sp. VKM Ac-2630]|uniref:hypothetical protein n=1 Tax=Rathayibacter sp. VKM Ac-2630 TaxID=1938617 RepID=UPI0031593C7C
MGTDRADGDEGLITGEAIALEVPVTSFVLRACGAIIDLVAEILLALLLFSLVSVLAGEGGLDPSASAAVGIAALVTSLVLVPVAVETAPADARSASSPSARGSCATTAVRSRSATPSCAG